MIRFGNVCDTDPAKCLVRVKFQDDGITSFWLPVVVQGSGDNKYFHIFGPNELVACLMDDRETNGVVLGAIYSADNQPDGGGADIARVLFKDGTAIQHDAGAGEFTVESGGSTVTINSDGVTVENGTTSLTVAADGHDIKRGGESLFAIINDLLTALQTETHTSGAPGSPTSPPLPPALTNYIAIQTRLSTLLTP